MRAAFALKLAVKAGRRSGCQRHCRNLRWRRPGQTNRSACWWVLPGGGTDIVRVRSTPKIAEVLGQQIVVDNRPGPPGHDRAHLTAKSPGGTVTRS